MTPEQIAQQVEQLCSLPDAVVRANQLIDSPNAGAAEIGEVIAHDPALTAQLLRLVNSAFYGFPSTIDSVSRAISVIGTQELRSLILSASAAQVFNRIAPELLDMDAFWHRSVYVGLLAGKLARRFLGGKGEGPFLTGLLHDIGRIVLCSQLPEAMEGILAEAKASGQPLFRVERQRLGFCSAEVGAALLDNWNIGGRIALPVAYQHRPGEAPAEEEGARLLNLAVVVSDAIDPELSDEPAFELSSLPVDPQWLADRAITQEGVDELITEVNLECFEVLQIINPDALTIY